MTPAIRGPRGTVVPCESHPAGRLPGPDTGTVARGGGVAGPSSSPFWWWRGAAGRAWPWRRRGRATAHGPGRWRAGPRWYAAGSRPPRCTDGGTGEWTWPPPRAPRCWPPRRAGSRSRARSPAAGWSRSRSPGRATLRCGPRTSRCARSSRRATRSRRGRWWPFWRRGRSTVRRAVCTGGCAARTRIWTRCHCCRPHCCGAGPHGCCRCSAYQCRKRPPGHGPRPG